jgi:hypothetical protein
MHEEGQVGPLRVISISTPFIENLNALAFSVIAADCALTEPPAAIAAAITLRRTDTIDPPICLASADTALLTDL